MQLNEWAIMINMIKFQNRKSIGQITQELNDSDKRRKFRRREKLINFIHHLLILISIIERIIKNLFNIELLKDMNKS